MFKIQKRYIFAKNLIFQQKKDSKSSINKKNQIYNTFN